MKQLEACNGRPGTRESRLVIQTINGDHWVRAVNIIPIGTALSNTCKPTFVHLPMGSRFTPRLINACARSRRRVRRVFVRMVTGRCTSLASKNSIAW